MSRWEPNAKSRLQLAAMELYTEHGFEQTTVAEIAKRAGLTERTFFRHFADKREVLFSGSSELLELFVNTVTDAPPETPPMESIAAAIRLAGARFQDNGDWSSRRQAVIEANPSLLERELIKMATLASAIAGALRARGLAEPLASLTAEAGIAVFKVSFERWVADPQKRDAEHFIAEALAELRSVTG